MALNDEVEMLGKVSLFAGLTPSQLKLLAFTSQHLTFMEGDMLFKQNDSGDAAYVVLCGNAEIIVKIDGSDVVVATLGENDIIGEIAILCDVPRTAGVRAATRLETLCIEKEQLLKLLKEFPAMAVDLMKVLAERLTATTADLSAARAELNRLSKG
ncbi:MAG: cyclic nucleotide-binding domain-containing protein [Anderseniella sp.]